MASDKTKAAMRKEALKLRKEMQDTGKTFRQDEFTEELAGRCKDLTESLYALAVQAIAKEVDDDSAGRVKRGQPEQRELFELEGEYKLGNQERIAKRASLVSHMDQALLLSESNLEAVRESHDRKRMERKMLGPYWFGNRTKAQAVEAFMAVPGNQGMSYADARKAWLQEHGEA